MNSVLGKTLLGQLVLGRTPPLIWDLDASNALSFVQNASGSLRKDRSATSVLTFNQEATGTIMAIIVRSAGNTLLLTQTAMCQNVTTVMMYGTVEKADAYFGNTLEGQRWMITDIQKKRMALISATRRIDRLNFRGVKSIASQPLQFPRGTDTLVPVEIEWACFELAQELLKGVDPNTERDNTNVTVQAYGGLRTEFDPGSTLPYMVAGIPSATAWSLLEAYLEERRSVDLERIT